MSPRLLGSFEYGRPSPAICRTVVGFIISGILSEAVRLLSVGTLIVTPPSIAYKHNTQDNASHDIRGAVKALKLVQAEQMRRPG